MSGVTMRSLLCLLALACGQPEPVAVVRAPAPPTHPVLGPTRWGEIVAEKIAATQRQPQPTADGFRLWSDSVRNELSADGAALRSGDGGALVLRVAAWGRAGAERQAEPAAPRLGGCTDERDVFDKCLRRVEQDHGGLLAWWDNGPAGLRQGFTVDPPPGAGPLRVRLAVDDATAVVEAPDAASLHTTGGARLAYAGLQAWDGEGVELPAWMEADRDGLSLWVDDRGARGAVTIDPVVTGAAWRTAPTGQSGSAYGRSVAPAGDVNGDGYGDLLVAAPNYSANHSEEGRVYAFHGSADGPSTTAVWTDDPTDYGLSAFGDQLLGVGDVNQDGFDDVAISARSFLGINFGQEGVVYLYHGSAQGLGDVVWQQGPADQNAARYGSCLAAPGDVNGDGHDDLVAGGEGFDAEQDNEGRVWLTLGTGAGFEDTPVWFNDPTDDPTAAFGDACAGGDLDGDGFGDVVVGAPSFNAPQPDEGMAAVYFGSPAGFGGSPDLLLQPADQADADYGGSIAVVGDVDGDGFDDVLISARGLLQPTAALGRANLYRGGAGGLSPTPSWTPDAVSQAESGFGAAVGAGGDVNGDGYADVLVGAPEAVRSGVREGKAFLYLGGAGGLQPTPAWTGSANNLQVSAYGISVSSAGDVNGDGYGDVLIGGDDAVNAWLYLGCPGTDEVPGNLVDEDCNREILCHVDADGDGFSAPADRTVASSNRSCADAGERQLPSPTPDCDDDEPQAFPGGVEEAGNEIDEDCDRRVTCYQDLDNDHHAASPPVIITSADTDCRDWFEVTTQTGDCDESDPRAWPGAIEAAGDLVDEDCDGLITCYVDVDGDGAAVALTVTSVDGDCQDAGEALSLGSAPDCDDQDPQRSPALAEAPGDDRDEDCDGRLACYLDADGDGFGSSALAPLADGDCADPQEASVATDCDDADPAVRPGGAEQAGNEVDEDCDGRVLCHVDADDDGYGSEATAQSEDGDCQDPVESVGLGEGLDCDDSNPVVHPGAEEIGANNLDDDCDGRLGCLTDVDGDGYVPLGAELIEAAACPDGTTGWSAGADCEDRSAGQHPGAVETPDNDIDEDCSEGDATTDSGGCASVPPGGAAGLWLGLWLRRRRPAR